MSTASEAQAQSILEAELAQMHLTELKTILVGKTKTVLELSELATRFRMASTVEVLEAKAKMRGLVGRSMFLEMEMREPLLLRIGR
jgi:hypothetical protein